MKMFHRFVVSALAALSVTSTGCAVAADPFDGVSAIALGATFTFGSPMEGGTWDVRNAEIVERGNTQVTVLFPNEGDVDLSYTSAQGRTTERTVPVRPVAAVTWESFFGPTGCVDVVDCPILVGGAFKMRAAYLDADGEPLFGFGILGAPATSSVRVEFIDTLVIEPVASGTFDVDVTVAGLGGAPIQFRSVDANEIEVTLSSRTGEEQSCSVVPTVVADGATVLGWNALLEWTVDGAPVDWIGPQRCSAGDEFVASVSGVRSAPLVVD